MQPYCVSDMPFANAHNNHKPTPTITITTQMNVNKPPIVSAVRMLEHRSETSDTNSLA
jgi:hypothetical protein